MLGERVITGKDSTNRSIRLKNYFTTGEEKNLIGWFVERLSDDNVWVVSSPQLINEEKALKYAKWFYGFTQ
jgi:hypothetical protein